MHLVCASIAAVLSLAQPQDPSPALRELAFQPNRGQGPAGFEFVARGREYALAIARERAVLGVADGCGEIELAMQLEGALAGPGGEALDPRAAACNYFIGRDRSSWLTNVPTFGAVRYDGVWPGIDVVYLGVEGRLQYDFHVAPHADPGLIRLHFEGARDIQLLADGSLALGTSFGRIVQPAPTVFQVQGGERELVRGGYVRLDCDTLGFAIERWDEQRELVIDPTVVFHSLIGSTDLDEVDVVRVAPNGNLWLAGTTKDSSFPLAGNGASFAYSGSVDVFVSELDPTGHTLLFSALIGGTERDRPYDMAIVGDGDVVVCGDTFSTEFPVATSNGNAPVQNMLNGEGTGYADAFVFRLTDGGTLEFSTYLGGNRGERANTVGLLAGNDVVVAGFTTSLDFPVHNPAQPHLNGVQDNFDGFVSRISAAGDVLQWSTYWGSLDNDLTLDLAVDPSDDSVVVVGATGSTASQMRMQRVRADGSFDASRDFGDAQFHNEAVAVAIAADGSVVVAGETQDSNFATVEPIAGQAQGQGLNEVVVCAWDPTLTTLEMSTYLSTDQNEYCADLAVRNGFAYVLCRTPGGGLPVVQSMGAPVDGYDHGYLACIDLGTTPMTLTWASYLPAAENCQPRSLDVAPLPSSALFVGGRYRDQDHQPDIMPGASFGDVGGDASDVGFVMRIDEGLGFGAGIAGFGATSIVSDSQQVTFYAYRYGAVAQPLFLDYTVESAGNPIAGLAGHVSFAIGQHITTGTINVAGHSIPDNYFVVRLTAPDGGAVDPQAAMLVVTLEGVHPPPPHYDPPTNNNNQDHWWSHCFGGYIARDTSMARDLDLLRWVRDNVLSRSGIGRDFTRWYYQRGPSYIPVLEAHPSLLFAARGALWMLLFVLKHPIAITVAAVALALLRKHRTALLNTLANEPRLALAR